MNGKLFAPGKRKAAPGGDFQPSREFAGARPGYYFRRGRQGCGYYRDEHQSSSTDAIDDVEDDVHGCGGGGGGGKRRKVESGGGSSSMYGGGLDEAAIQRLLAEADTHPVAAMDAAKLKQMVSSLVKAARKNQRLRVKHPDDPTKFMDSEVNLDEEIKAMHAVAAAPELYSQLVSLGGVSGLVELLTHDNTDISLEVIDLLNELTDPAVLLEAGEGAAKAFRDSLLSSSGLELLLQNLARLDEGNEGGAKAVHNTLGIVENLVEVFPAIVDVLCAKTPILRFLIHRLQKRTFDPIKLYCAEVLTILLQTRPGNCAMLGRLDDGQPQVRSDRDSDRSDEGVGVDGVDLLLQAISYWRRRDPQSEEERECCMNIYNALCTVLMNAEMQDRFRRAEGFELMLRCLKNRGYSAAPSIKAIDYGLSRSKANVTRFLGVKGLKSLFPWFMGLGLKKQKKRFKVKEAYVVEHTVSALTNICLALQLSPHVVARAATEAAATPAPASSPSLSTTSSPSLPTRGIFVGTSAMRLIAKFEEAGLEKTERLVHLYLRCSSKMQSGAGLFTLYRLAIIAAHCCAASPAVRHRVESRLEERGQTLATMFDFAARYARHTAAEEEKEHILALLKMLK